MLKTTSPRICSTGSERICCTYSRASSADRARSCSGPSPGPAVSTTAHLPNRRAAGPCRPHRHPRCAAKYRNRAPVMAFSARFARPAAPFRLGIARLACEGGIGGNSVWACGMARWPAWCWLSRHFHDDHDDGRCPVGDGAQPAVLAGEFERSRGHLRAVAFRMLGSADDADDAVQDAWLRASAADASNVVNLTGWLTTIVGRVCLDMLRARRRRGEQFTDMTVLEAAAAGDDAARPEDQAIMADSVGLALMVVLDRLGPAERVALVLPDLFPCPLSHIAGVW